MTEYFVKGGPVMYVLLALSVYALGVFLERLWHIWRLRMDTDLLLDDVKRLVARRDLASAQELLARVSGPVPGVLAAGVTHLARGAESARDAMQREGERAMRAVEGNTRHLAIIGNLATMLGLLGTITGMIGAFAAISEKGLGNPNVVAGGISEALLTTAYGLMVAIPAITAYNFLDGRVEAVRIDCEAKASLLLDAAAGTGTEA